MNAPTFPMSFDQGARIEVFLALLINQLSNISTDLRSLVVMQTVDPKSKKTLKQEQKERQKFVSTLLKEVVARRTAEREKKEY